MRGTEFQASRALPWAGEQLLQRMQSRAASGTLSLGSALHSSSARLWACLTPLRALLLMWKGRRAQDAERPLKKGTSAIHPLLSLLNPLVISSRCLFDSSLEPASKTARPPQTTCCSPVIFTILRSFFFVSHLHLSFCSLSVCFVVLLTLHIKNSHFPLHLIYPAAFL